MLYFCTLLYLRQGLLGVGSSDYLRSFLTGSVKASIPYTSLSCLIHVWIHPSFSPHPSFAILPSIPTLLLESSLYLFIFSLTQSLSNPVITLSTAFLSLHVSSLSLSLLMHLLLFFTAMLILALCPLSLSLRIHLTVNTRAHTNTNTNTHTLTQTHISSWHQNVCMDKMGQVNEFQWLINTSSLCQKYLNDTTSHHYSVYVSSYTMSPFIYPFLSHRQEVLRPRGRIWDWGKEVVWEQRWSVKYPQ